MFKRVFSFILIVVMLVCTITACTITAEAEDVYFATHSVTNEYDKLELSSPESHLIEVDYDAKEILVINTKTHSTASYTFNRYTFNRYNILEGNIIFFNEKQKIIGYILFHEYDGFLLIIKKEDGTSIIYDNIDD